MTHVINYVLSIRRLLKITDIRIPLSLPLFSVLGTAAAVYAAMYIGNPVTQAIAFTLLLLSILYLLGVWSRKDILWLKGLLQKK